MASTDDDKPRDFPFELMCDQAKKLARDGVNCYQRFTCVGCGARLTIEEPNKFYETADCDQCKTVTNIKERGCNYMLYMVLNVDASKPEER